MAAGNTVHVEHWICLLVFSLLPTGLGAVQIRELSVPSWIENGTMDHVILDCEFDYSKDEKGIVVKWFLNDDPQPIYQWIPEHNSRTTSVKFQKKLDLDFKISNKLTMHRALKILRPTIDLSGKYRCDVLSLESQDSAEGIMIIYAPPKKLEFIAQENPNRGLNLSCEADNVYPRPQLGIFRVYPGETKIERLPSRRTIKENTLDGTFDIAVNTEFDFSLMPEDGPAFFECEILMGTHYSTKTRLQYFSGSEDTTDPTNGMEVIAGSALSLTTTLTLAILARMFS